MGQNFEETSISNVKPIRDIVYSKVKRDILEGRLKPGERIIEKEYAEKLNISRTPIREALRKLEIAGFVYYIPRKGIVVKSFKIKDVEEIYEILKSLESLAVKKMIQNIDDNHINNIKALIEKMDVLEGLGDMEGVLDTCKSFNKIILKASCMPRLIEMINNIYQHLERFKRITLYDDSRRLDAIKEHIDILQAIIEKDIQRSQDLVCRHIKKAKEVCLDEFYANKKK